MKQFIIPFLLSVAVLSIGVVNRSSAHEGHKDSRTQKQKSAPRRVPVESPRQTDGPQRLAPPGARQATPHTRRDHRVLDIRTLAIRLEFAAEIVSEEIRFDMPPTRAVEHLLAASHDVETAAHHFRESLEQGADADHLRKDFHAVGEAFAALGRSLRHYHGSFLVDRAMFRTGRIIGTVTRTLDKRRTAPNFQEPPIPGSLPGEAEQALPPRQSLPPQLSIPPEMKGISLLPREQQAAALAQKTCPVTGDLLGSLGKPFTVRLGDRTIFVCCEDCVEEMKADPKKYLTDKP